MEEFEYNENMRSRTSCTLKERDLWPSFFSFRNLPPSSCWLPPQVYLSVVLVGEKRFAIFRLHSLKFLKCKEVNVVRVPHLKNLMMKEIQAFARGQLDIAAYRPDYEYSKNPNREWYLNLCKLAVYLINLHSVYTLKPIEFEAFIKKAQKDREKYLIRKRELNVKVVPEIARIIRTSQNYSSS